MNKTKRGDSNDENIVHVFQNIKILVEITNINIFINISFVI